MPLIGGPWTSCGKNWAPAPSNLPLIRLKRCACTPAQQRFLNCVCIQFVRAQKRDEACKPAGECLRKRLVFAKDLILQPQAQDDKRIGRPVEFAVEARHEPVAPQYRQRVVAELALVPQVCRPPTRSRSRKGLWLARGR